MLVTVVDDDESMRESLPDLVREFGYAATAFPSAEAFLVSHVVDQTQCLILDLIMPGMGGLGLMRELARRSKTIPIVFITAQKDDAIRDYLLSLGANECLFKPFSEASLLDGIKVALCNA
jgi:FixJ family two-component response regulator